MGTRQKLKMLILFFLWRTYWKDGKVNSPNATFLLGGDFNNSLDGDMDKWPPG